MWRNLRSVFLAIPKGLSITFRYLFRKPMTEQYPKTRPKLEDRYRGLHYLARYDDGTERCVCCGLCAAACPADAIYMEPAENERGERYARIYEINLLRCIFCGFCEEACPEEAIFLGRDYEFATDNRGSFIYPKEQMLVPHPRKENPFKQMYRRLRKVYGVPEGSR